LFFVLLIVIFHHGEGAPSLFAMYANLSSFDSHRESLQLGSLSLSSGAFTPITTGLVFDFTGTIASEAATYDQDNQIYYFFGEIPFLYGIDVANNQLLPPVYLGLYKWITQILWSKYNNQIIVYGTLSDGTTRAVMSYPANGPSKFLIVLNSYGVPAFADPVIAYDDVTGTGYVVFATDSRGNFTVLSFPTSGSITGTPLVCTPAPLVNIEKIFFDSNQGKLVGLATGMSGLVYFEFANASCSSQSFTAGYNTVQDAVYDPVEGKMYILGSYNGKTESLFTFVPSSSSPPTSIAVMPDLINLAVSF